MALMKQRGAYVSVTEIPVLIPCGEHERDGVANFLPGSVVEPERNTLVVRSTSVRALRDEELKLGSEAGKKLWSALDADNQARLLGLIGLRSAVEVKDSLAFAQLAKAYQQLFRPSKTARPLAKDEIIGEAAAQLIALAGVVPARVILALELSRAMERARLVLWWYEKKERFQPAIYCPDVTTALYVRALLGIAMGNALLVCPKCGKPFLQQRSDQDYCSMRCREAYRVARWRAGKKAAMTSKAKKRGSNYGSF